MNYSTAIEILRQGRNHSRWNEAFSFMIEHDPQFQNLMYQGFEAFYGFSPSDLSRHCDSDGQPLIRLDNLADAFGIERKLAATALDELQDELGDVVHAGPVFSRN